MVKYFFRISNACIEYSEVKLYIADFFGMLISKSSPE
jgi:hypothetical protein